MDCDRTALETYQDARAALALICEAIEELRTTQLRETWRLFDAGIHDASRGARHLRDRWPVPAQAAIE